MKRSEGIYLATDGFADESNQARAAELLGSLGQRGTLRRALEARWLWLERASSEAAGASAEPQSPAWFAALLGADARRWQELSELARALSEGWNGDVITLEGAPAIFWVRYSRWTRGTRKRCFEYAASDVANAGWVRNEGEAEAWEEDDEVGPDLGSLTRLLALPSLEPASDPRLACCATEVVAAPLSASRS